MIDVPVAEDAVGDVGAFCNGVMVVEVGEEMVPAVSVELDDPAFSGAGDGSAEKVGEFLLVGRLLADGIVVDDHFA